MSEFHILIVEDDPRMRRVLELLLGDRFVVSSAPDGAAALQAASQRPPDLIVADLLLPGVDGLELLRELRLRPRTANVPVIMISGVTEEERRVEALQAGASDFLVKPFSQRELLARATAQLEMLDRRRRSDEVRLATILDAALDAVVGLDGSGRITYWNAQAERTFGWSRSEAVGRDLAELILPPTAGGADGLGPRLRGEARPELTERLETVCRRRDGGELPVEMTISCASDGSQPALTVFVADITGRKRAERERERLLAEAQEARRQAEAATRAKDHFMATLSHELRTPLNAIVGWTHLLRSGDLDEAGRQRAVDVIERNARVQSQLIGDILDVTRIVQGKLRLDIKPVPLPAVVRAVLDTVRPSAEAKSIAIRADVDDVPLLDGDPDRLQQVLWNLLSNAIKFTPKRGTVDVRLTSAGSHLRLVVQDSGPGISSDFLPHVFEAFSQDTTSPRTHGGLGLGLAIVRHLVEMHGGSIEVASREGRGTTFTVKLPLRLDREVVPGADVQRHFGASTAEVAPSMPRLDGVHVVVVDDEADTCDAIVAFLTRQGATATATHNVDDAMAALQRERPHVLLSDIAMPGHDGYELIRQIRGLPAEDGGLTPVAALTAYATTEDRVRALTAGFHLHVAKPVDPSELVTVVASLAGRAREV